VYIGGIDYTVECVYRWYRLYSRAYRGGIDYTVEWCRGGIDYRV